MSGRQEKQARVISIATRRKLRQVYRDIDAAQAKREAELDAASVRRMRNGRMAWAIVGLALFAFCIAAAVFG